MALVKIPFEKGIFFSPETSAMVPEGFFPDIVNLTLDEDNVLRKRFNVEQTIYQTNTLNAGSSTFYASGYDTSCYTILGTGTNSLAAAIWFNLNDSGGAKIIAVNKVSGASADSASFPFNYAAPCFTEYNSIIYASNLTTGVRKITALNFGTSAITETLVAASPIMAGILTFKNRLFGWSGNRVYYTDVPAPGGLPEIWNVSANFFDIGSSRGTPIIHNILPVENRLFFFTDSGLFSVLISGPANTWVQKSVDESIRVRDRYACLAHKNIMYFVDDQSIWATNGVEFTDIGGPVKSLLDDIYSVNMRRRFRLFLYNNKLIFHARLKDLTSPGPTTYTFVCSMGVFKWTRIYFSLDATKIFSDIHMSINDIRTRAFPGSPESLVMLSFTDTTSSNRETLRVFRSEKGEGKDWDSILGSAEEWGIQFNLPLMDFGDPLQYKILNFILIEVESPLMHTGSSAPQTTTFQVSYYADEQSLGPFNAQVQFNVLGQYNKGIVRIEGPSIAFKWIRTMFSCSLPVNIKAVYMDFENIGLIEPAAYTAPGV